MTDRTTGMDGTDVAGGRTVTIADLLRIPLRRWWLAAAGALCGLLAGVGYLFLPASFEATAVVAVRPVVTEPFSYPGPGADRVVNMTVEDNLATGTEVITAVAGATGQSPPAARRGLTVELPVGSQVLRFRYVAPDTGDAIAGANAAANAYLKVRRNLYQSQRDAIVSSLDASVAKLSVERDKLRLSLPTRATSTQAGNSPAVTAQLDRLRGLDEQLAELTTRRAVAAAVDVTPGSVVRIAQPPLASNRDAGLLYPLAALLAGLLFGAVAAYGLEGFDRRVRSGADAAAVTRLPVLAELSRRRFRPDRARRTADLRYLALAILGQLGPVPHRRIVLLGVTPGDPTTEVGVELTLALAEQGHTVRWEDLSGEAPASRSALLSAVEGRPALDPPRERSRPEPRSREVDGSPLGADGDEPSPMDTAEPGRPRPVPVLTGRQRERAVGSAAVALSIRVADGRIWLDAPSGPDDTMITVVRSAAAERDDRGVRAALEAAAVLVIRRDHTRVADLDRFIGTLRLTGARTLGLVLVSGHD